MSDTHTPLTASQVATLVEHGRTYDGATGIGMGPRTAWAGVKLVRKAGVEIDILRSEKADLLAACEDKAVQLEALSTKLAPNPPGHVDYINKADAAEWAALLARELRAAVAKAKPE